MNATDTIKEALREFVGDGDGADEAVLAEHDREVRAEALDVEEMARVISSHRHGSEAPWPEDRRTAEALRAAILGGLRGSGDIAVVAP
jgi:hypothetical protein